MKIYIRFDVNSLNRSAEINSLGLQPMMTPLLHSLKEGLHSEHTNTCCMDECWESSHHLTVTSPGIAHV